MKEEAIHKRFIKSLGNFGRAWLFAAAYLFLILGPGVSQVQAEQVVDVDFSGPLRPLDPFWNASGMSHQPKYLTDVISADMQMIGSVPHQGNHYQRPHNLLMMPNILSISGSNLTIDWSGFDKILDDIIKSGQQPYFELMGIPMGAPFSDEINGFKSDANLQFWRNYVHAVTQHCEDRYGAADVRQWYFEVWNEPDLLPWDAQSLSNYFDASRAGLDDVDPMLRFGGPGASDPYSSLIDNLIDHALSGINYFTGQTGTRIDFVSWHNKQFPDAQSQTDADVISGIRSRHPSLGNVAFINSEADSEVFWTLDYAYRATPWYSSYIARQVTLDQSQIINGLAANFRLSNDNAFIGAWGNRTQLTWFGGTDAFALIKKPQHNIFTVLSLLGNQQAPSSGDGNGLSALASIRGANQAAVLLTHYSNDSNDTSDMLLTLNAHNLPFGSGKIAEYRIDPDHSNVYKVWQNLGSPTTLSQDQLQTLRDNQELRRISLQDFNSSNPSVTLHLPAQGVSLLLWSADPGTAPSQVTDTGVRRYTSVVTGKDDLMVTWRHDSRVVKTFEVYYSPTSGGTFTRVNGLDILCNGFTYQVPAGSPAFFKVRAVDYWGRAGAFSGVFSDGGSTSPTISLNPTSLTFNGTAGGSNPPNQSVTVSNSGSGTLNWTGVPHQNLTHSWNERLWKSGLRVLR